MKFYPKCCSFRRLVTGFQTRNAVVFFQHSSGEDLTKGPKSDQTDVERTIRIDILSGHDLTNSFLCFIFDTLNLDFFGGNRDRSHQSRFSWIGSQNTHKIREFPEIRQCVFAVTRQLSVQEIKIEAVSETWKVIIATVLVAIFVSLLCLSKFQVIKESSRRWTRLDFGKVNVTEGEASKSLIQGSSSVRKCKDNRCLGWNILSEVF